MSVATQQVYFRPPRRWTRRMWPHLRRAINAAGTLGMTLATAGYARWIAPFQIEWHELPMPLKNLPSSFEGYRIVHLSDLHMVVSTPRKFLRRIFDRVNSIPHDLVLITGDLITSRGGSVEGAAEMLQHLRAPVIVSLGNHDYADEIQPWLSCEVADRLEERLERMGITVLRNRAMPIERADGRLWIVGLEDLWSGRFNPDEAFAGVSRDEPVIAMSHNPDTAYHLEPYGPGWILSGHTHGGQVRVPVLGSLILPVVHKHLDKGQFQIGNSRLYVTRGVGFYRQVRFRCPGEIPTFTLVRV